MQFVRFPTALLAPLLFLFTCLFSLSAPAAELSVPGITDPSLPQFMNDVRVRANHGNWTISGNKNFTFNDGSQIWDVNGRFRLTASFDDSGAFVDGGVSIIGRIPDLGIGHEDLMTADLISFGFTADGLTIGFNTNNIVCSPLLGVNCTVSESVVIALVDAYSGNPNDRFMTTGYAVTSVPLPAALLLFVSGLGWIFSTARRRAA